MEVTRIKRVFVYDGIILEDISSTMSEEDILNHYSRIYPELNNAQIENKGIVDDKMTFHFNVVVGTKG